MIIKKNTDPWIVLFGGKRREQTIFALIEAGIEVTDVIVPKASLAVLSSELEDLSCMGVKLTGVSRKESVPLLTALSRANILSIGWPYILPEKVISHHNLALNVHPTLLPRYAGPSSGAHIILNNEQKSGSTLHVLTSEPDSGPMLAQNQVSVGRFDTTRSVQRKVYAQEPALVVDTLNTLQRESITAYSAAMEPDFFPARTPKDSEIDARLPLAELYDVIRASDPDDFPAHFYIDGQKVCIRLWRETRDEGDEGDMI